MKLSTLVPAANLGTLTDTLKKVLNDALAGLLTGAVADLQGFVVAIVEDMANVGAITDAATREAVSNELQGQLKMVAELNRVRAVNEQWNAVSKIVAAVAATAVGALTSIKPI